MSTDQLPTRVPAAHGVDHAALASASRRLGALRVAERRLRAERPFLSTFLLTALGNPIAYLAAMGVGLGSIVTKDLGGVSYLHFVAPALIVSTAGTTGGTWGTWPIFGGFKWERSYEAASATTITPGQIVAGESLAMVARLGVQGLLFWLLGHLFGAWLGPLAGLTILAGILTGLAFFTPLAAYSATLKHEGLQFNFINRLILMPMFLFAGTFFPLATMPPYLQWIGWISPMWHGTQLARVVSYGLPLSPPQIAGHLAFLVACIVLGLIAARHTFTRRLTT